MFYLDAFWSKEKPTVVGHYWMKNPNEPAEVVKVENNATYGGWIVWHIGWDIPTKFKDLDPKAEWQGITMMAQPEPWKCKYCNHAPASGRPETFEGACLKCGEPSK